MIKPTDLLSIGQLGERTGLSVSAIRYYETQGLIESERNAGGQRRFLRSDIRRLSFVQITQQFGFSIERIRDLLAELPDGRTPNKADWRQISRTIRKELDDKIQTLEKLRDNLDGCIGCGCLSLRNCTLYNEGDYLRKNGFGPRLILGDKPVAKR
ncbi:MAG: redox-sensitive transcriptional activator SoxR [Hyphomicrobiales bacterium]